MGRAEQQVATEATPGLPEQERTWEIEAVTNSFCFVGVVTGWGKLVYFSRVVFSPFSGNRASEACPAKTGLPGQTRGAVLVGVVALGTGSGRPRCRGS